MVVKVESNALRTLSMRNFFIKSNKIKAMGTPRELLNMF